jgi:hypothetical protein
MTPKEKAKELTYRFYRIIPLDKMTIDFNIAKKFALITIDEIIKDKKAFNQISVEYWEDVKQEIEEL